MITEKEIMDKLYELPEHFNRCMKNKEYRKAKQYYEEARNLCAFLKVTDKIQIELFGNRPYKEDWEEEHDGLFREEDVLRAYKEVFTSLEEQVQEERENRERFGKRIIYREFMTKK